MSKHKECGKCGAVKGPTMASDLERLRKHLPWGRWGEALCDYLVSQHRELAALHERVEKLEMPTRQTAKPFHLWDNPGPQPPPTTAGSVEPSYPCDRCGKPRTAAQGGKTFTVCDECWGKRVEPPPAEAEAKCETCGPVCKGSGKRAAAAEKPRHLPSCIYQGDGDWACVEGCPAEAALFEAVRKRGPAAEASEGGERFALIAMTPPCGTCKESYFVYMSRVLASESECLELRAALDTARAECEELRQSEAKLREQLALSEELRGIAVDMAKQLGALLADGKRYDGK